jgi:hypothetical protein
VLAFGQLSPADNMRAGGHDRKPGSWPTGWSESKNYRKGWSMISGRLLVTYSQIAIFNSDLEMPFNDWNDAQVNQGFSWREEAVSFRTLIDGTHTQVEVDSVTEFIPSSNSVRSISVPFLCNQSGGIEVATITDSMATSFRPGQYQLVFETGLITDSESWCRFSLIMNGNMNPTILKLDNALSPEYPLLMGAAPG